MHNQLARRDAGLTMIGITVYAALLTVFGGMLASVVLVSSRSTTEHDVAHHVNERNRVSLFRVAEDVRTALASELDVSDAGRQLLLTQPEDFGGAAAIPGDIIGYQLRIAGDESLNGVDDNGNGIVDEGELVRRDQLTGTTVTICRGVDLARSSFAVNGAQVSITLANVGSTQRVTFDAVNTLTVIARN